MSKELEICKMTFKLAINAFDFCENMASIGVGKISAQHHEMKKYHQQAIMILDNKRTSEKTKYSKLSSLLRQMEMLAGTPTPKFPKGAEIDFITTPTPAYDLPTGIKYKVNNEV